MIDINPVLYSPGGHPVTLYIWRHLHGDAGSVVKVLQHVVALGVLDQAAEGFLHGEHAGVAVRVVKRGSCSPACEENRNGNAVRK